MKPEEELMRFYVSKVSSEKELKEKLALFFPGLQFSRELIPKERETDTLKSKEITGIDKFYYYSRRGKKQFHEFVLDLITNELKRKGIKYKRARNNRGADLEIGKLKIELEIRSNPPAQPEKRRDLKRRINRDKENTVILLLNNKDKKRYLKSEIRTLIENNNRFFTVQEFLEKINSLKK